MIDTASPCPSATRPISSTTYPGDGPAGPSTFLVQVLSGFNVAGASSFWSFCLSTGHVLAEVPYIQRTGYKIPSSQLDLQKTTARTSTLLLSFWFHGMALQGHTGFYCRDRGERKETGLCPNWFQCFGFWPISTLGINYIYGASWPTLARAAEHRTCFKYKPKAPIEHPPPCE